MHFADDNAGQEPTKTLWAYQMLRQHEEHKEQTP